MSGTGLVSELQVYFERKVFLNFVQTQFPIFINQRIDKLVLNVAHSEPQKRKIGKITEHYFSFSTMIFVNLFMEDLYRVMLMAVHLHHLRNEHAEAENNHNKREGKTVVRPQL